MILVNNIRLSLDTDFSNLTYEIQKLKVFYLLLYIRLHLFRSENHNNLMHFPKSYLIHTNTTHMG